MENYLRHAPTSSFGWHHLDSRQGPLPPLDALHEACDGHHIGIRDGKTVYLCTPEARRQVPGGGAEPRVYGALRHQGLHLLCVRSRHRDVYNMRTLFVRANVTSTSDGCCVMPCV